jgi:RNA recognition motif-containing protein
LLAPALITAEQNLHQLFESYGSIDTLRSMPDRATGHSQGFGGGEMPDSRAAQAAIDARNGTQ